MSATHEVNRNEAHLAARNVWLTVQGVRTYARVQGSGPPLVIVPGLGCSHVCYTALQSALAPYFEVWAYDAPGHGYTRAAPNRFTTVESLTEQLAAWLVAHGLTNATLLGHSLGGQVLLHLAARHPQLTPRLVLSAPTGLQPLMPVAQQVWRVFLDGFRDRRYYVWRLTQSYLIAGPRRVIRLYRDLRHAGTDALPPQVQAPTLVLQGEADEVVRSRALRRLACRLPRGQLVCIEHGPHALIDKYPVTVTELVREFARVH
ncbi:alpha/beta fold hydrolase [Deinococcus peraridilitoris]|uniref:alpha/beta fold hydrolase n=1 Tax=Deinococcus peraridilitoris TaxID=432329 RepID=UPI0002FC2D2C|nr:alpha/beta fold hydrolase [Deinococcus peraridilitoris]